MSKSKKLLNIATIGILIVLIVCTFLSKHISETLMPVVEVVTPFSAEMSFNGEEADYYVKIIPSNAIILGANNTKQVYVARERKGLFGAEIYITLLEVSILAENDEHAAIGGWNVTMIDDIVISSSKELKSGDVVKIADE